MEELGGKIALCEACTKAPPPKQTEIIKKWMAAEMAAMSYPPGATMKNIEGRCDECGLTANLIYY